MDCFFFSPLHYRITLALLPYYNSSVTDPKIEEEKYAVALKTVKGVKGV